MVCDYGGVYCCEVAIYVLSVMMSGCVLIFVVYLVLLNVVCFLSWECVCVLLVCVMDVALLV